MDLLWDERRLFVAGPDSTARMHEQQAGTRYVALRFSGGLGPALLGVPADELRDQLPDLDDLWPSGEVRHLGERVAADPGTALEAWVVERAATRPVDPIGAPLWAMANAGVPAAAMADRLGLSARQLLRRSSRLFGYGPRRLARVLRLRRTLDAARVGAPPLAQLAVDCGYFDQSHLNRETEELARTTPAALLAELGLR